MPSTTESMLGGHCVSLVGYTDVALSDIPANHFIGMNSWGTGWGIRGFFAIPYSYITNPNLASDFWLINSVSSPKPPTPKVQKNGISQIWQKVLSIFK